MSPADNLNRTPLFETHQSLGARIVEFAGWEMPIQYGGILDEVRQVRTNAGLFDVSHMGRLEIEGPDATALLDSVLSVNVPKLRQGRARYNVICDENGGIIDDCIVYRRGEDKFLLIPNASNTPPVVEWLERWTPDDAQVTITNITTQYAMIANQGPKAVEYLQKLTDTNLSSIRPFRTIDAQVSGHDAFLARTGYTGEDGFEIILPSEAASDVWRDLMAQGAAACGLGARDVLRLEAGLLLHGNDMDTSINPYEAALDKFVDPDRAGYVAGPRLRQIRDDGPSRKLAAFSMVGRGIPRHGYAISDGHSVVGEVSSGGPSPTLDMNIGLGYVPTEYSTPGSTIYIDIRGRPVEARVTTLPFYTRRRSA
ncbi:MAG: glycine cleavage system aminomethyltransferase GcvT [Chloroflexi bacterium]|nr:glycine cleavage system aminomethyltransferase GcvT [Chloroflexota bacterium]